MAAVPNLIRLDCTAQSYAWGKVGAESLVHQFLPASSKSQVQKVHCNVLVHSPGIQCGRMMHLMPNFGWGRIHPVLRVSTMMGLFCRS